MAQDLDPRETQEWVESLDSVVEFDGADRAAFLLEQLHEQARRHAVPVPFTANTPYLNTIPVDRQPEHPADREIEHKIRSLIRWNAVATVLRANKESSELGGHIIGAGIVGPSAGDLIAEAALAIETGADAADIGLTIHPHPTLSETVAMAAEAFEGTFTDLYMPKKR
jgi:hypothetical protein